MESFIRVADLRSFTKAAESMYLTQPTISGHIRGLEKELGVRLLDRARAGVTLTEAGRLLYNYARRLLQLLKETQEAMEGLTGLLRGELRIGGSTIPGEYILPPLIGRFKRDYPGINLLLKVGDTMTISNDLLKGEVDLAVVGAKLYQGRLLYKEVFRDEITLVAATPHPLSAKGEARLSDLPKLDLILREEGSATRLILERRLKDKGTSLKDLKVVAILGSTSAVKEGVLAQVGVSFLSRLSVKNELEAGLMKEIRVRGLPPMKRSFFLAVSKGRTLSPAGKIFLDRILGETS